MESYIIKVYVQDLAIFKKNLQGYIVVEKQVSPKEMFQDLKSNGLEIIQWAGSHFADCFFIEVTGKYTGDIEICKHSVKPKDFNWKRV